MYKMLKSMFIGGLMMTIMVPAAGASTSAHVRDRHQVIRRSASVLQGGSHLVGKALTDTQYLYGGPGTDEGKFETAYGPDWMGWTHEDLTAPKDNHWHISAYYAANLNGHGPGNRAMWCGDSTLAACSPSDSVGGMTANMYDPLDWRTTVTDPMVSTTIRITGFLNYDTEPGYDYVHLFLILPTGKTSLSSWTGTADNVPFDFTATVLPGEYTGAGGNEIKLEFLATSDGAWDDFDCQWPTHGAAQLDDIAVMLNGAQVSFDDFEAGSPVNWEKTAANGVGDFAALRSNLGDLDLCQVNNSVQVSFIDDGIIVPGTGGSPCITWCYGLGGYILNSTDGLMANDPDRSGTLNNRIISPPIAWEPGLDAATYAFDVYRHENLAANSPGMLYQWLIRSTSNPDPADLEAQPWQSRNFLFMGGPEYFRQEEVVSDLLAPGIQWVQLALGVVEWGQNFGFIGNDGTPAPYFDNVALKAWTTGGPEILINPFQLFTDAFVESGIPDPLNPVANSCRLDIANNVDYTSSPVTDHGDSMVAVVTPRNGGFLNGKPVLHWVLQPNTGYVVLRGALRGSVLGQQIYAGGAALAGRFSFDLPDTGFFYPGDILHWYLTAEDDLGGDIGMSSWPADTTAVLDFTLQTTYPNEAQSRALPTLIGPAGGAFTQPDFLVVDSAGDKDHTLRLLRALRELGFVSGQDFDLFTMDDANGGDSHQGLAGMVSDTLLATYSTLFYDLGGNVSSAWRDFGQFIPSEHERLNTWVNSGSKNLLLSGNDAAAGMPTTSTGLALMSYLGVGLVDPNLGNVNGGVPDLQVSPVPGNGVLPDPTLWLVNGGCPGQPALDAITATGFGVASATLDPQGVPGGIYAALVSREDAALSNRLLTVPFDLARVLSPAQGYSDGLAMSGRARLLGELLDWLSLSGTGVSPVPRAGSFAVDAAPNPFNPVTTLSYNLPQAGHFSLQVFDIRGRLVRSLVDGPRPAGAGKAVWNGLDDSDTRAPSGVYFYQARSEGEVKTGKITMIK